MTDRAPCIIIGCRRTFKRAQLDWGDNEYMCGDHYRMSDKALRQLRTKLRRRAKRIGWTDRLARIDNWLWARIKKQATERTLGI